MIVLTLNRLLKSTNKQNKQHLRIIAAKLFKRVTSTFSLKYKEIQKMIEGLGTFSENEYLINTMKGIIMLNDII